MDIFESKYYRQSKYLLTLIGHWPYSDWKVRFCARIVFVVFGMSVYSIQICEFLSSGFTSEVVIRTATPMLCLGLASIRYIFYWVNMDMIKKLLDYVKSDWAILRSENESKVAEHYANLGRAYGTYYIFATAYIYVLVVMLPLVPRILDVALPLNETRPYVFLYDVDYFVDREKYYYLILLYSDIIFIAGLMVMIGSDLTLLYCAIHASGSFSVVGYCFEHMFDHEDRNVDDAEKADAILKQISHSVERHGRAVEYLKLFISSYVVFLIIQLFFAVFTLSVFLFQAANSLKSGDDLNVVIMAVGNAVWDWFCTFAYLYPAQQIIDCSGDLFFKAYNGPWYMAPLKVQKLLLPILRRTIEANGLTVFGVLTASMELFATILRMSMSYFTLLCTLQQ